MKDEKRKNKYGWSPYLTITQEQTNRASKKGFMEYMKKNPFYLEFVFPGKTPEQAWKEVKGMV